jgi:hypothetical protein
LFLFLAMLATSVASIFILLGQTAGALKELFGGLGFKR